MMNQHEPHPLSDCPDFEDLSPEEIEDLHEQIEAYARLLLDHFIHNSEHLED